MQFKVQVHKEASLAISTWTFTDSMIAHWFVRGALGAMGVLQVDVLYEVNGVPCRVEYFPDVEVDYDWDNTEW